MDGIRQDSPFGFYEEGEFVSINNPSQMDCSSVVMSQHQPA